MIVFGVLFVALIVAAIAGLGKKKTVESRQLTAANPQVAVERHKVRLASAAHVVVSRSGFTQKAGASGGTSIEYGLVLTNKSKSMDALNVQVSVGFVDTHGRSIANSSVTVTGIPAGGIFYVGGAIYSNVSLTAGRLRPAVTVGRSQPRSLVLPSVSDAHVTPSTLPGEVAVNGDLRNPYKKSLPVDASIYVIYLDSSGHIIGGTSETTGAQVRSHASDSFNVPLIFDPVASVEVSVDPCSSFDIELHQCPANVDA